MNRFSSFSLFAICFLPLTARAEYITYQFSGTTESAEGISAGTTFHGRLTYDVGGVRWPETDGYFDSPGSALVDFQVWSDAFNYKLLPQANQTRVMFSHNWPQQWSGPTIEWFDHTNYSGVVSQSGEPVVDGEVQLKVVNVLSDGDFVRNLVLDSTKTSSIQFTTPYYGPGGNYWSFSGKLTSLQPVPEPSSMLVALVGFTGMFSFRRRWIC